MLKQRKHTVRRSAIIQMSLVKSYHLNRIVVTDTRNVDSDEPLVEFLAIDKDRFLTQCVFSAFI